MPLEQRHSRRSTTAATTTCWPRSARASRATRRSGRPVWTDVNDNDPGITLVQVFAWLTEMLAYRMNKVPELNYIKFLQLHRHRAASRPSRRRRKITFPVQARFTGAVRDRARAHAGHRRAPDGGPPMVFETERALIALTRAARRGAGLRRLCLHAMSRATTRRRRRAFNHSGRSRTTTARCCSGFDDHPLVAFPSARSSIWRSWTLPDNRAIGRVPMRPARHALIRVRRRSVGNSGTAATGSA